MQSRALILAVLAGLSATAQQDYRLRVTVDLVQVDATVTDAQGNPVPDLKATDFRVLLDDKPQELKFCNYSKVPEPPVEATLARDAIPAGTLKHQDVRRTIVLFIGDLLTSAESMPGIRAGLKKFVQEQVRPGDLVAIVRSSAGLGALQDFTPDKRMLLAAVDQVCWTPHAIGNGGASAYETIGQPSLAAGDMAQLDKIDSVERATLSTTASLQQLIRGMAGLPGKKSVILLSDALRLSSPDEKAPTGDASNGTGAFLGPIYQSMCRLVDESLRAGVVLYAIDTRTLASSAGESARFAFQITSTGPKPKVDRLELRTLLFRDGVKVWESTAAPIETDAKKTASLFAKGSLEVPKGLDPGKYMVRVDIDDKAQPNTVTAWQWAKLTLQ